MLTRLFDALYQRRLRKSVRPPGGYTPKRIGCWDCAIVHDLPTDLRQAVASAEDFFAKHLGHACNWFERPGVAGMWTPNADVKQALQAIQTFTVTSLQSLASSNTTGFQTDVVDNTANLYLDALVMVSISYPNSAPAGSKAAFLYAYGGLESGVYTSPASGTQGTITLVDITANPTAVKRIGTVPILVQNTLNSAGPFSVGMGFGGTLPSYWGCVIANQSGQTFNASLNTCKYRGQYLTIL
jgi:hypothetical protein